MKTLKGILFLVILLAFNSCQKENDPQPNPTPNGIKEIVVKSTFDWKTTQEVSIQLTGYANSVCVISHADGTLFQKVFLKKNEPFTLRLNIPAAEKKLWLDYMGQRIELEITGSEIVYQFN